MQQSYTYTGQGTANVVGIQLNGNRITTQQVGSIVIGQQATLSVNGGKTVQTATWTVTGTTIGGWTPGQAPTAASLSQASPSFYWVAAGSNLSVTVSGTFSDGTQFTGSGNVNVSAPSVTVTPTNGTDIWANYQSGNLNVGCGHGVEPDVCIILTPTITPPQGVTGTYEWAQIVTANSYTVTAAGGSQQTCIEVSLPALDNGFPSANDNNETFEDSPQWSFSPGAATTISQSMSFTNVLLWQPNSSNSIYVPVATTTWGWSYTVSYNNGTWSLTSTTPPSAQVQNGLTWPVWSSVATNGSVQFGCN